MGTVTDPTASPSKSHTAVPTLMATIITDSLKEGPEVK